MSTTDFHCVLYVTAALLRNVGSPELNKDQCLMKPLLSSIKTEDASFQVNGAHHKMLAAELQERTARIRQGGGETARQRHTDQGKLFVHDSVTLLLDPQSPFLELSPLADWDPYDRQAAAAGIPQVAVVMGSCTAGGAYVPAMSDEAVIVKGTSTIFLGATAGQGSYRCGSHSRRTGRWRFKYPCFRGGRPSCEGRYARVGHRS